MGTRLRSAAPAIVVPVCLIVLLVAGLVIAQRADDSDNDGAAVGAAAQLPPPQGVSNLSRAPSPFVNPQVVVWTGRDVVTFGGVTTAGNASDGGARFTPATGAWEALPALPFDAPLARPGGVWTKQGLVVVGILCNNDIVDDEPHCNPGTLVGAVLDATSGAWKAIPMPPNVAFESGNSGYFGETIGRFGDRAVFSFRDQLWAYDPMTDRWEELPAPRSPRVCSARNMLVSFDPTLGDAVDGATPLDPGNPNSVIRSVVGFRTQTLSTGDTSWVAQEAVSYDAGVSGVELVCGDGAAFAATRDLAGSWVLEGRGRWTQISAPSADLTKRPPAGPVPTSIPNTFSNAVWSGTDFVFWNADFETQLPASSGSKAAEWKGNAVALDLKSRTWRSVLAGPDSGQWGNPNSQSWQDGYALYVALIDGGTGIQAYRP